MNFLTKILIGILVLFGFMFLTGLIILSINPNKDTTTNQKIETPKIEEKSEVRVSTPKESLPINMDEDLVIVFKEGYMDGCTKSGNTSYDQCLYTYKYIYNVLGSSGILAESAYYNKYGRVSDNMTNITYLAVLSCI